MTILTECFVLLWLLPVTLFIILPLTVGAGGLAYAAARGIVNGKIPFISDHQGSSYSTGDMVQKRGEQRHYLADPIAVTLVNGSRSSNGFISNFSNNGICIEGITEVIAASGEYLNLLVGEVGKLISLDAELRWVVAGEGGHTSWMRVVTPLNGSTYL